MKRVISKVVIFRAGSLGDNLMGKFFLENVHAAYPDAKCCVVVGERGGMIRGLLSGYPWIEVREVNRRNPMSVLRLVRDFFGADLVYTQNTKGIFSTASKIVGRLIAKPGAMFGYEDPWWGNRFVYSKIIHAEKDLSVREHECHALGLVGIPVTVKELSLNTSPDKAGTSYILVHLFPGNEGRGFSPENKARIVAQAAKMYGATHRILLTGSKQDRGIAEQALQDARGREKLDGIDLQVVAGDTDLPGLIRLIAGASGVISADTGVAHIAAHLRRPLVVIRSCVGRSWWLPGQYDNSPLVIDADAVCAKGHVGKLYPACINGVDFSKVRIPGLSIA